MPPVVVKQALLAALLAVLLVWMFLGAPQPAAWGQFRAQPWAVGFFLAAAYLLLR